MKQVTLLFDFSKSPIRDDAQMRELMIQYAIDSINFMLLRNCVTVERLPDVKYDDSVVGETK